MGKLVLSFNFQQRDELVHSYESFHSRDETKLYTQICTKYSFFPKIVFKKLKEKNKTSINSVNRNKCC